MVVLLGLVAIIQPSYVAEIEYRGVEINKELILSSFRLQAWQAVHFQGVHLQ